MAVCELKKRMRQLKFRDVIGVVLLLTMFFIEAENKFNTTCPTKFVPIHKKCYYFSKVKTTWDEAYFGCTSLNSSLAIITGPRQELAVRRYLNGRRDGQKFERWIGGRYNEKMSRWVWGENGKSLIFHGFSRMSTSDGKWAWHCIVVDPAFQNKWRAKSCLERKRYICQKSDLRNNKCGAGCIEKKYANISPGYLVKTPAKKKKIYDLTTFICPSHMILVGRSCYFFSVEKTNWSYAYWACRDNKTKLAVITTKLQDNILRGFLRGNFIEKREHWIGGIYDWKQERWKWAMSGRPVKYANFADPQQAAQKNNTHHSLTLDPEFDNKWNSKNWFEDKYYICQAKPKRVVKYNKTLRNIVRKVKNNFL